MTGGLIQLVAYGFDDIYLTKDPQITFFKVIYRRHTNFSTEQIPVYFTNPPDFGKKSTCQPPRAADLMGNTLLVVEVPKIRLVDEKAKFAWIKRLGFGMIKSIEVEINGRIIDRHYGEWLNIWSELTGEITGNHNRGINNMIGNVSELYDFSSSKDSYTLYIPLKFWFCRNVGLSLPLICLQYSDIKINVEFEDAEKCYVLSPTHYIKCRDDIVNFIPYEYIEQNINGELHAGIFIDYDISTKRLYYAKLTPNKITSIPVAHNFDISLGNQTTINNILSSQTGIKYSVVGKTSGFSTFPEFNYFSLAYPQQKIRNLNIVNCFLLIDYHFLDTDERMKFAEGKHDYLIEQLFLTPSAQIDTANTSVKLIGEHPCKLLAWVAQQQYLYNANDLFNYTDSYQHKIFKTENPNIYMSEPVGKSLIIQDGVFMNGGAVASLRDSSYFNHNIPYKYSNVAISTGINIYSFANDPLICQPTGTCNLSQIDITEIKLNLSSLINVSNIALFRGYALCYNIFRVSNGYCGLVFAR